ncbi:MAG: UDP-N-acetylmuramate dehydrogenase [Granulosicoccus sp.]
MVEHNKSLKQFNTFGFDQRAEHFATASNDAELEQLVELAQSKSWPVFVLGGGSNIVLTKDLAGLVIHMADTRVEVISDNDGGNKRIKAGAGVGWHDFVLQTLALEANGLENLSLIPGSVGAAPVQNIGAYGVEVKDRIHKVRALHMPTGEWREFSASDCEFAYRHSFFKNHPGEYAITQVEFNLGSQCAIEAEYSSLKQELHNLGLNAPSALDISRTVTNIRQSRLPDPTMIGNAGSFFHNPIVTEAQASELLQRFPSMVNFPAQTGFRKLSAAWMIDQAGFKGVRRGNVGVYEKQALVLINLGDGRGCELLALAQEIQASISNVFGVDLSIEPNVR